MREFLEHLADQVLALDPDQLIQLLPDLQARMRSPESSQDWERAVVAFFIINGLRSTKRLAPQVSEPVPLAEESQPHLRVVK